jgi:long-chain acyl-CoA synthetase
VSPANLEAALKTIVPIGQACAVGDKRPFVAALVVLDPEVAPSWFRERGIEAGSLAELADDPRAYDELQRAVDDVMIRFSTAERVRKIAVLSEEWLPDSDELTPTSKLKRRGVLDKYSAVIEAIYG